MIIKKKGKGVNGCVEACTEVVIIVDSLSSTTTDARGRVSPSGESAHASVDPRPGGVVVLPLRVGEEDATPVTPRPNYKSL
jgi:hypothetical protein